MGDAARAMGSLLDIMMARVDRHKDVVGLMTMLENLPEGKKTEEWTLPFKGAMMKIAIAVPCIELIDLRRGLGRGRL